MGLFAVLELGVQCPTRSQQHSKASSSMETVRETMELISSMADPLIERLFRERNNTTPASIGIYSE
jgi:ornithine carbamoyltransferase